MRRYAKIKKKIFFWYKCEKKTPVDTISIGGVRTVLSVTSNNEDLSVACEFANFIMIRQNPYGSNPFFFFFCWSKSGEVETKRCGLAAVIDGG